MPEKPVAEPMEAHVAVVLNRPGDQPKFHFETNDLPLGEDNVLTFNNRRFPGYIVHFDVDDSLNPGFRFPDATVPDQLAEAIYVRAGRKCPSEKSKWPQFWPMEVINSGKTLKVRNENRSDADFAYTLRLINKDSGDWLELDPVGNNKNGATQPFMASWIAPTAAGAIVAIATVTLVSSSFVPATAITFGVGGAVVGLIVGLLLGRR